MTQTQLEKVITVGVFNSQAAAQQAVAQLRNQGFGAADVQTVAEDQPETNEPGNVKAKTVTKSYKGLVIGAIIGGVIGALIGLLFGNGTIPFMQNDLIQALGTGGMILVGLFIGVALGTLGGSMSGLSWAQQETKGLEKSVEAGQWLVTLQNTDTEAARAALRKVGAIDLKTQTPKPAQVNRNT